MLIMQFMGVGLNRTSLAAFIIAMGMLVDNAIVVTDNAQILIKKGMRRRDALIKGATVPQWGLLGGYADCYIFFFTLVFGAFFRGRDGETVVYRTGGFAGIELDSGVDANDRVR